MSQLLSATLLVICILILSIGAFAQDRWSFVGLSVDKALWFVDKAVMKKKSGVISAWEKVIYTDKSYSIALNEWKCTEKMKRFIQVNHYDPTGDYLDRDLKALSWRYIVPDSIEERTYKILCSDIIAEERTAKNESNSSFAQIIKKSNLMSEADSNSEIIRKVIIGEKLALVSEESTGVWYRVFDAKTNSEGWVNGNYFKIVKASKPARNTGPSRRNKRRN